MATKPLADQRFGCRTRPFATLTVTERDRRLFAWKTNRFGDQTACSHGKQRVSATKPPVRMPCSATKWQTAMFGSKPLVRGFGYQTECSICEQPSPYVKFINISGVTCACVELESTYTIVPTLIARSNLVF